MEKGIYDCSKKALKIFVKFIKCIEMLQAVPKEINLTALYVSPHTQMARFSRAGRDCLVVSENCVRVLEEVYKAVGTAADI